MSNSPVDPLPRDIEQLLEAERRIPGDAGLRRRVFENVLRAVAVPPLGGDGGGDGGGGGDPGDASGAPISPTGSSAGSAADAAGAALGAGKAAGAGSAGLGALVGASTAKTIAGVAAVAFLAGGITGSAVTGVVLRSEPVPIAQPSATSSVELQPIATTAPAPSSLAAPSVPFDALPTASAAPSKPDAGADVRSARTLAEERELLDVARAEIARGNHDAALATLARHAARFPGGQLAEEREVLRIRALTAAGRDDEVRAGKDRFRKKYPDSMLLPAEGSGDGGAR